MISLDNSEQNKLQWKDDEGNCQLENVLKQNSKNWKTCKNQRKQLEDALEDCKTQKSLLKDELEDCKNQKN